MTQEEFNRLPMFLKAAQVEEILGLDWRQLKRWREENPGVAAQVVGQEWRFHKSEVAKAVGLKY